MFLQAAFFWLQWRNFFATQRRYQHRYRFPQKGDAEPSPVSLPLPVTDADLSCWGQDSCRYKENRINTSYFAIYRLEESSGYGSETL